MNSDIKDHSSESAGVAAAQSDTNDQIAKVMLLHGTPEQQQEAAKYAGQPEPVGEEVGNGPDIKTGHGYPAYSVTQHQRIVDGLRRELEHLDSVGQQKVSAMLNAQAERDQLKADKDHLIQQAQIQAQEARTQRSTVLEIGELVGCHNDWEMAGAVRSFIDQLKAEVERLKYSASEDLVSRLVSQLIDSGAKNYQEITVGVEIEGEMPIDVVVILQKEGNPTPHQLRVAAEVERNQLKAEVARLTQQVSLREQALAAADQVTNAEIAALRALLAAQKIVMPERIKITKKMLGYQVREAEMHNACLDEVIRLNKGAKP